MIRMVIYFKSHAFSRNLAVELLHRGIQAYPVSSLSEMQEPISKKNTFWVS